MPLEETSDLLKKDKVKGIAISGMMGTGKTAIMKNLNNHEEVAKIFDMVMWIKVSTGESKENLDMSQLISNELKGKRYLLLLDDLKADLDIYQMGIPPCENGSKIVLTTRESHIRFPRVDRVVKVTYLSPKESFRMFQDVANCPKLKDDRGAEACAWKIIREYGGHPLLIYIIASVFQKKDLKLWSEGFKSLKRFSEKGQHELKELRDVIKFCHDDLKDTQRKCYGVLYPEEIGIYIDCLLECWEAEDFLGNGGDSRKAYINGIHILNILKDKSLLEEDESRKYVMMHKCIRQVLLYILSDDPNSKLLVQQTPPDAKCWSKKIWISLIENKFDKLPDCPNSGSLSTLFLQENLALKSIPASFFEQMTSLKVLDLCHTGIELLPSSLSKVIGLKVLYLSYCEYLKELPSSFGKLEHLEVLDIRGSGFNNIPSYIGNLNGLRHFRVSFAKYEGIYHPIFEVLANVDAFDLVNKKDIKQLSDLGIPSMKESFLPNSKLNMKILDYTTMVFMSWSNELSERSCS
ncbi:Disease resistance protein [Camellia lanceoleosa]|uniref:Disease resistance protein n=1 Tax=Camellia lanceoleosa TaxID=1840588 RepID=A0ACC0ITS6_9ERIC|nr:Disease resistance protein [Camellia lanceoleosa]